MSRARVAMNLLWCVPGVGGSEEYLVRQLLGLHEIGAEFDVDVFAPLGFSRRQPTVAGAFRVHEAPSDCMNRVQRVMLEHTWLARRTRDHALVHHGGGTVPRSGNPRTLLTIHDVQWIDYPHYVRSAKLRYLRLSVPSSLRRATRVAVPSRFVAGTLTQAFAVPEDKIGVVRHGLESTFDTSTTDEATTRAKFGLGAGPVLVFPAITHPHKNHRFLLELMQGGQGRWGDPDLKVVFAGSAGMEEAAVLDAVASMGQSGRVVMPGRVSNADRNGLLAIADAMVFPSQYEGFGAPVIEAMRLGTPVITSDRGSLPEVVGDAGIVCPLSPPAWVHALDTVRMRRDELVTAGRERAEVFTAAMSARDLVDQYDEVISFGGRT